MFTILSSIPSPSENALDIGPFELRFYGLMIAIGVLAAVGIARRRWQERGGDPDDITGIALWAVPGGLVGSRLYHVITDWQRFWPDNLEEIPAVWEGGVGIPGGIIGGVLTGMWVAHRRGLPAVRLLDIVAPGMLIAQAIGRVGNWFNQELFGDPTDLPWALEIDPGQRIEGFTEFTTFHPTFAYEALWNLGLAALLVFVVERHWKRMPPGQLFGLYIAGYALGRFWVESLRIDPATNLLGARVNLWVMGGLFLVTVAVLIYRARHWTPEPEPAAGEPAEAEPAEGAEPEPAAASSDGDAEEPGDGAEEPEKEPVAASTGGGSETDEAEEEPAEEPTPAPAAAPASATPPPAPAG